MPRTHSWQLYANLGSRVKLVSTFFFQNPSYENFPLEMTSLIIFHYSACYLFPISKKREGFSNLYNCWYSLLSNLFDLQRLNSDLADSYTFWRHWRLGRVLYPNRLENGCLKTIVPRCNIMNHRSCIVYLVKANVIHDRKYLKLLVLLPCELNGWSLNGRQIAGLTVN